MPSPFEAVVPGAGAGSKNMVAAASSGLFVVGSAFKAFARVPTGERGVRTKMDRAVRTKGKRTGELYGIVQPGWHLVVPFTHAIKIVSVQDRNNDLDNIEVNNDHADQMTVRSSIKWAIRADGDNPFRALFNIESIDMLKKHVSDTCSAGLQAVIDGTSEKYMKNQLEVEGNLKDYCRDDLLEYGSELRQLKIKTVTRTFGQMIVQANISPSQAILGQNLDVLNGIPAQPLHVAN